MPEATTNNYMNVSGRLAEAPGLQLVCPYCHHKFKAPQGLISHKYMHERAGESCTPPLEKKS